MVNLKPESLESSDGFANLRRNHRNWGSRFGRDREVRKQVPNGLLQLDELAQRSVMLMEKYGSNSKNNYHVAMDLLRLQYNLNFIVLCEKCNGPHAVDKILAPER